MEANVKNLRLLIGLQSGGSSLLSYCICRHSKVQGVFDGFHDRLISVNFLEANSINFIKFTCASYSPSEVISYYESAGYAVSAVILTRSLDEVYQSLKTKPYGYSSVYSDFPPLFIRFLRFTSFATGLFNVENQKIKFVDYDEFLKKPRHCLEEILRFYGFSFCPRVIEFYDKDADNFLTNGNESFKKSIGLNIESTILNYNVRGVRDGLMPSNYRCKLFDDYQKSFGYRELVYEGEAHNDSKLKIGLYQRIKSKFEVLSK